MKALQVKQPGFVPGTAQTDCGINIVLDTKGRGREGGAAREEEEAL